MSNPRVLRQSGEDAADEHVLLPSLGITRFPQPHDHRRVRRQNGNELPLVPDGVNASSPRCLRSTAHRMLVVPLEYCHRAPGLAADGLAAANAAMSRTFRNIWPTSASGSDMLSSNSRPLLMAAGALVRVCVASRSLAPTLESRQVGSPSLQIVVQPKPLRYPAARLAKPCQLTSTVPLVRSMTASVKRSAARSSTSRPARAAAGSRPATNTSEHSDFAS